MIVSMLIAISYGGKQDAESIFMYQKIERL
jgi:hypothetical protein